MPALQTASDLRDFTKLLRDEKKKRGEPDAVLTTPAPLQNIT